MRIGFRDVWGFGFRVVGFRVHRFQGCLGFRID